MSISLGKETRWWGAGVEEVHHQSSASCCSQEGKNYWLQARSVVVWIFLIKVIPEWLARWLSG